jgi:hypothetical protein
VTPFFTPCRCEEFSQTTDELQRKKSGKGGGVRYEIKEEKTGAVNINNLITGQETANEKNTDDSDCTSECNLACGRGGPS